MATIQSTGLVRNCQHERITCRMEAVETTAHHTGQVQFSGFMCPDCQQEFEVVNQSGQPVPHASVNIVERSRAIEAVRASVPAKKPAPDPSLAKSHLNRDGLLQGSVAPEFKLPTLDGSADVALADYAGRRVLLVFISNGCPHCDVVAPYLQRLHDSGFPVVAIGNRMPSTSDKEGKADTAAMREKVAKFGLTFPVLMQHQWRVSRDYGSFGRPIGYIVGPDGVLEKDIISGSDGLIRTVTALLP